jgi:C1A family cysteine protease
VGASYFVDLRNHFTTPIYSQGNCGNCYAYATVDSVNMLQQRDRTAVPPLSIQHLTDCSKVEGKYNNFGCQGGYL